MAKPSKPNPATIRQCLIDSGRVEKHKVERTWPMLEEMLTLYYPPFRADTDDELLETALVALRRYVLELGDFKHEVLDRAWAEVVRDHKVERWPTIGVIVDACEYRGADGKSARFLPGERKGYHGPVRARPDFSYQVENGMMEQDLADRLTARYRAQS